jgi:hypothetical protein
LVLRNEPSLSANKQTNAVRCSEKAQGRVVTTGSDQSAHTVVNLA